MAINKAFGEWKAAYAAYVAAERELADAESVFSCTHTGEPVELRLEVTRRRTESENLLKRATDLLHSRVASRAS